MREDRDKDRGRALDAAIAEALGYELIRRDSDRHQIWESKETGDKMVLPYYSEDGNAMLELIAELTKRSLLVMIEPIMDVKFITYQATIIVFSQDGEVTDYIFALANTMPKAVSLAVFKALTGKEWQG